MDKYSVYVIVVYGVTFVLLLGYLVWLWARLRAVKDETGEVPR
ncbi:heme exporter protein CcmD [Deinococcus saxicola]